MASLLVEGFEQLETEAEFANWLRDVLAEFCSTSGPAQESELYRWMDAEELGLPEEALATIYNRYIAEGNRRSYRKAVEAVLRESAERGEQKVHEIVERLARLVG